MRSLADMQMNESAVVSKLNAQGTLKKHLIDMGIVQGTKITVNRIAPLGGPTELLIRDCKLCIRRKDAALIEVQNDF